MAIAKPLQSIANPCNRIAKQPLHAPPWHGPAGWGWRGGAALHHTTMAYQMNVPLMLRVLRIGKEKLSDKGITSADKRVGLLREVLTEDGKLLVYSYLLAIAQADNEISQEETALLALVAAKLGLTAAEGQKAAA